MKYRNLNINGATLSKEQLEVFLEKMASDNILKEKSSKETYPIPKVKENFEKIKEVYELLNEHIKLDITIHPAGEWLLDNFYIIDETVKTIIKEMPMKKYIQFTSISNGLYNGFARAYVIAHEIVSHTDNKIDYKNISDFFKAYQRKKTLSMEEIWNIGIFIQIAIIESIKNICEKIYFSQMQKYRVENIIERIVENKQDLKYKNLSEYKLRVKGYGEMKYPFIEYMSYKLKKQGKYGYQFMNVLEEEVNMMGTTIQEVINKEHYDIAVKKVSMANSILSIKEMLRIDFLKIFEETNEVEEILRKDPAKVYEKMDVKTKEYYRNKIRDISKKASVSEIYVARKILELAKEAYEKSINLSEVGNKDKKADAYVENKKNIVEEKKSHIGYYLIEDKGINELYSKMGRSSKKIVSKKTKEKIYIFGIWGTSILANIFTCVCVQNKIKNIFLTIILAIFILIPIQEIISKLVQYILGKVVRPKLIPKLDMSLRSSKGKFNFCGNTNYNKV